VRGFLLDSHITAVLVPSVKRVAPTCEVIHLADWRGGIYLHAHDDEILENAYVDDLVLVTHDVSTIPILAHEWIKQGRTVAGVAVIAPRFSGVAYIGGLARALGNLYDHPHLLDPAYPIVYVRPAP